MYRRLINLLLISAVALSLSSVTLAQDGVSGLTATPLTPAAVHVSAVAKSNLQGRVSVIVKLDGQSLAAYRGDLPGLAATNPRLAGTSQLDVRSSASQAYLSYLAQRQSDFEAAALQAIPTAQVVHRYRVVLNAVSMLVPTSQVGLVAGLPGVQAVYHDQLAQVDTERSPAFIGAPRLWQALGGQENAGEGVIVGVIDTGIWPEHPSFSDPDPLGNAYDPPPAQWTGTSCDFGNMAWNPNDAAFICNNKLIGADTFLDTYKALIGLLPEEFDSARDDNGHGTHTTSTAAGNGDVAASIFGVPRGTLSGIAPRAHVAMYRACADEGCFFSDLTAAVDQAVADGVDVINYSISGGSNPYSESASLAFLDAYAAGVFVSASAGNSGPGADTTDHREPWVTTVAASTTDRHFLSKVHLNSSDGSNLNLMGASVTAGIAALTPVVRAADVGDTLCQDSTPDGAFAGAIVVCERGVNARVEKSYNVMQRGAVGMLLYNPELQGLATDNHFIPSVHLENDAGTALLDFLAAHPDVTAQFIEGTARQVQGDVMASFSSRGGPGQTLGVSKPDVTAPGVQILAGHTPLPATVVGGSPGELFQAIQGTSMSAPHVAGAGALLADLYPDWTPGQIKSALMTTAQLEVTKEDAVTPADPFDDGSGRIDLRKAGSPGLTIDDTDANYLALENELWKANYPSLYVPDMPGSITVSRTVHSHLGGMRTWVLSVDAPSDVDVIVPASIDVPGGGDTTFDITVDARDVPLGEVRHATLFLNSGPRHLHFPITIVRGEPDVTLDKSCAPATFAVGATTDCTVTISNTTFDTANVSVSDELPAQLALVPGSVVGATESGNGWFFDGALFGAAPPSISVVDGDGTTFGYLPLSLFGVPPFAGMGDETAVDLSVPAFIYAGVTYGTLGMISNGYAEVGGTTSIEFINQFLPDAALPNNVLAPFWTDLNVAAGGAMRAAILTDGVNDWIVLDWEAVPEFSDGGSSNFQIWIGVNGVEDIFYTYGAVGDGDGSTLTVGAEDADGISGSNWYVDTTFNGVADGGPNPRPGPGPADDELRVVSVPGTAGETKVITFSATGAAVGTWTNYVEMSSDLFDGINIASFSGEVTP